MSNTKELIIDAITNADDETLKKLIAFVEASEQIDVNVVTTFQ